MTPEALCWRQQDKYYANCIAVALLTSIEDFLLGSDTAWHQQDVKIRKLRTAAKRPLSDAVPTDAEAGEPGVTAVA
jgi:hypothetical protein